MHTHLPSGLSSYWIVVLLLALCFTFSGVKGTKIITLNGLKECPAREVIVYNDRAEITRLVNVEAAEAGEYIIQMEGLSNYIDDASVGVGAGVGDATILEVSAQQKIGSIFGIDTPELKELDKKLAKANLEKARIQRAMELLDNWADSTTNPVAQTVTLVDKIDTLIDSYDRKKADLDEKLSTVQESINELGNERNKLVKTTSHKDINLTIRANKPGEINLLVSYVVHQVAWTADYDVRVKSDTAEAQLSYYGTIINNSGEDWDNVSVALSTATPSVDGNPPDLRTLNVKFMMVTQHHDVRYKKMAFMPSPATQSRGLYEDEGIAFDASHFAKSAVPTVKPMTSQVVEGMSATTFDIPRKANIPSDGQPHKVTIGIFELKCNFSYMIVPKMSSDAYLKANISNVSERPLLGGQVRVFVDNNFVAHSNIKYVPVGEKFNIYLGVDKAIQVERNPDKLHTETLGLILKSTQKTYRHSSVVKNTKMMSVPIVVYEQIPYSTTEEIKIQVVEPNLSQDNPEVFLNSKNIIEWHTTLAPNEQNTFKVEYRIEFPTAQTIQLYD